MAAGFDPLSIYERVGDTTMAPVISSVVNTTVNNTTLAGPAINIAAGLSRIVKEVVENVVEKMVAITTNTTINSTTMAPTTVVPPSSSSPSTISTVVKKVVEHLGKEPYIPAATVCIFFLNNSYISVLLYCTFHTVYSSTLSIIQKVYNIILYTINTAYFYRPAAFRGRLCLCWWWRLWVFGWG